MPSCYKCGEPFLQESLPPDAVCARCSSYLHCCANCLNYDELATQKCREARAPYVSDRHVNNKCPFFKVRQVLRAEKEKRMSPRGEQSGREGRAREGLEKLFKS